MPLYDYDCANCGKRFEVLRGVHTESPSSCLLCGGGPIKKAFATPAIHFKGSGWAKKERQASASRGSRKAAGDAGSTGKDGASGEATGGGGPRARDGAAPSSGDTAASPTAANASTSSASSDGPSGTASKAD